MTVAILGTDVVFAIDSVPAVYGITGDPYLVFATNAFALLGLRALFFVVAGALGSLRHLGHGLAAILAFIGVKLVLHWAHGAWSFVPEVPTLASLGVIVGILALATTTSILANRRDKRRDVPRRAPDRVRGAAGARAGCRPGLTGGRMERGRALCRPDPSHRPYCAGGTRVRRMRHPTQVAIRRVRLRTW